MSLSPLSPIHVTFLALFCIPKRAHYVIILERSTLEATESYSQYQRNFMGRVISMELLQALGL